MDDLIIKSLKEFVNESNMILNNSILSFKKPINLLA